MADINNTRLAQVPEEVARQIFLKLPLTHAVNPSLAKGLPDNFNTETYLNEAIDPIRYLEKLVDDGEGLLTMMLLTNTSILGCKTVEYFLPYLANTDSEWIFYCCGDGFQRRCFLNWLTNKGLELDNNDNNEYTGRIDSKEHIYFMKSIMCKLVRREVTHKIKIVNTEEDNEINIMLSFNSSIYQCCIAGYGAICIQSYLTSEYHKARFASYFKYIPSIKWPRQLDDSHIAGLTQGELWINAKSKRTIIVNNSTMSIVTRNIDDADSFMLSYSDILSKSNKNIGSLAGAALKNVISNTWWIESESDEDKESIAITNKSCAISDRYYFHMIDELIPRLAVDKSLTQEQTKYITELQNKTRHPDNTYPLILQSDILTTWTK